MKRMIAPCALLLLACGQTAPEKLEPKLKDVELREAPRCPPGKRPEPGLVFRVDAGGFVQGAFPPPQPPRAALRAGRARLRLGRCPATVYDCAQPTWFSDGDVEILEHKTHFGVDAHTLAVPCVADPDAPPPPPPPVGALAFSPDGTRLAALDEQHLLLRRADLGPIADVPFAGGTAVVFSPDGTRIAVAGPSGVALFDAGGAPAGTLETPPVRLVVWGGAGGLVTAGTELVVWDVAAGKPSTTRAELAVDLAPDGSTYALSDRGGQGPYERPREGGGREWIMPETHVRVLDLASGKETFSGARVNLSAGLLARGDFFLRDTSHTELYRGGQKVAMLATPVGMKPVAATPDGSRLGWVDGNYVLSVVDTSSGRTLLQESLNAHPTAMALSPDGRRVVVGTFEQGLRILDIPGG